MNRLAFILLLAGAFLMVAAGCHAPAADPTRVAPLLGSLTTLNNYLAGTTEAPRSTAEALKDAKRAVRLNAAELGDPDLDRHIRALESGTDPATLAWQVAAVASRAAALDTRLRTESYERSASAARLTSLRLIAPGALSFGLGFGLLLFAFRRLVRERAHADAHLPGTPDEPLPARVGYLRGEYERAARLYNRAFGHRATLAIENRALSRNLDAEREALAAKRLNEHTRLPLRELLDEHLRDRLTAPGLFSVLAVDLDEFKSVNDTYGHDAGDAALAHAGVMLRAVTRPEDFVAHVSGDEFYIVSGGPAYEAVPLATRLRDAVSTTPFVYTDREGREVTPRIGLTVGLVDRTFLSREVREQREATAALLKLADTALNQAKTIGRGEVHIFDPGMNERAEIPDWEWIRRNLARIFWTRSDEARGG